MFRTLVIFAVLAYLTRSSFCDGYFEIVGSKTIQPNSDYSVSISVRDISSKLQLTLKNDKDFSQSKVVAVQPYSSQVVKFSIGPLLQSDYKLIVEGLSGFKFKNETTITLQPKYQSVFIQSDKAMYRPGDKVKFRVMVLDENLNPATINEMNVFITDATQNRIKQWLNVNTTMGVYIEELQLSTNPPLGIWNFNVNVNKETHLRTFEIAEYILPKFEVTVSAAKDLTYSDNSISVKISATYTYGAGVKGIAVVSISPPNQAWSDSSKSTPIIVKTSDINGIAYVKFKMNTELKVTAQSWQTDFDIKVAVTEGLTGKVLYGSTTVTIRRNKFVVTNLDNEHTYTPLKSFPLNLQFAYYDGSPYIDTTNPIKVSYGSTNTNTTFLTSGYMNSNGVANFGITLPITQNGFYVFVSFLDFNDNVGYYSQASTTSTTADKNSISVQLLTKTVKIGQKISVQITSSKELSYVNYILTSRGKLLLSATKSVTKLKTLIISFTSSFAMVPSAQFVAYYVSEVGDVVSGSIKIPVTGLNNFVTLGTSAAEKKPGESVNITISTKPSSYVCLLGVDQSVTLLKSGNDIQQSDVYAELSQYNSYVSVGSPLPFFPGPIIRPVLVNAAAGAKRSILPPTFGRGSRPDFDNANVFILTNANDPPIIRFRPMPLALASMAGSVPLPAPALPPQSQQNAVNPTTRKYFPETWIWSCNSSGSSKLTLPKLVPDTITSWYLTAFATNNKYGLGVIEEKTIFKVFKPFFVSLNLPYSVKRGETIALSIIVFNYMSQNVTANVTLDNSLKQFEFIDPLTEIYKKKGCAPQIDSSRTKSITIPSNDGVQLSYLIAALITGLITIKVKAISPMAGDAIEIPLLVVPEGVTQYRNKAKFVDLRNSSTYSTTLSVEVPANAVPNSTQVSFSAIGDVMGVTLQNIQELIRLPCGCGEQTMIGLAPDVSILYYLTNAGLLTSALQKQLNNYLEVGYQGELTYLHSDGSVSAFGKSDASGSSWLTAFMVKVFIQASKFITIDNAVIIKALEWLKSLQKPDGSFPEPGRIIHSDMQGDASKGVALTAYIAIAFAQDGKNAQTYGDVISRALNYVQKTLNSPGFNDVYSLAIASYAAQLANHGSKNDLLLKLDGLSKVSGDLKWWEKVQLSNPNDPWCQPPSVNVEITGYALKAYVKAGKITDGLPVMRWLLAQQSPSGGFSSTQDTVVGIDALADFAAKISGSNSMSCTISYETSQKTIKINKENSLVRQSIELPSTTKSVKLTCTGSGFSLAQLTYQFNLNNAEIAPRFNLDLNINKTSNDNNLVLNICTSFIAGSDGNKSNMAVIEAELPTGFSADLETIKQAQAKTEGVKNIETRNSNTIVVIYLDDVTTTKICLQITGYRMCQVADEKPVSVQVYDYYNNIRRCTKFYRRTPKDVCGICVDDDCKAVCRKPSKNVNCPKQRITSSSKNVTKYF